ncbi:hypothetical protein [Actinomycetospora sp. TBRC 11914]|uniref:hypothetical protein n=1 Tax=Actinomycetospora sp. TBRC 11914 TaxID=2729387 RepID=UPI00145D8FB7|nr:hypothetical protein [Actinomycetospora sp. TBRC 11914]NMO88212.1 hypothetical protein [Actinomycetospora sp. TBRC 11914]
MTWPALLLAFGVATLVVILEILGRYGEGFGSAFRTPGFVLVLTLNVGWSFLATSLVLNFSGSALSAPLVGAIGGIVGPILSNVGVARISRRSSAETLIGPAFITGYAFRLMDESVDDREASKRALRAISAAEAFANVPDSLIYQYIQSAIVSREQSPSSRRALTSFVKNLVDTEMEPKERNYILAQFLLERGGKRALDDLIEASAGAAPRNSQVEET